MDVFWIVHITFGSMFKIQSLAQFPVNFFTRPILPILVLILYLLIMLLISIFSPHNLHLLNSVASNRVYALLYFGLMGYFCALVNTDSVSLFRILFFSHVHIFLCAISLVCRLKYPYSCFTSHFFFFVLVVFLSGLILLMHLSAAAVNCSLLLWIYSSISSADASMISLMLMSPLPPCFLDTYNLSMSSTECKAVCKVINCLVT